MFERMRTLLPQSARRSRTSRFLAAIRNRPSASLAVLVLLLVAGVLGAYLQARRVAAERVELIFETNRDEHKNFLDRLIGPPSLVPGVLAGSKTVRELIAQPNPAAAAEQSEILEKLAHSIQVDVIYLLDSTGNCVATSNWRERDSFLGQNYAFRPYFEQAIAGRIGHYTAIGVTSQKLGHYLSRPVTVDGRVRGVVVAKLSFDAMQARADEYWRRGGEVVLLADENGVVIVSPVGIFNFKAIRAIGEDQRATIEADRQYGREIPAIVLTRDDAFSGSMRQVEFKEIPQRSFLQRAYALPDLGLQLYLHTPASSYRARVSELTFVFSLLALVVFLACTSLYQRWAYAAILLETAIRDPLTGLNTRRYMYDWCQAALGAHDRDPAVGIGLAVLEVDSFKQINDAHGHLAGDEVLRRTGEIIRAAIRAGDLAVRFGGKELALFVRGADAAEAIACAERIRHRLEQTVFQSKAGLIKVTLSGGVAYRATGETLDALFARADQKLCEARELGGNRIRS